MKNGKRERSGSFINIVLCLGGMTDTLEKRIFLICPVRGASEDESQFLQDYLSQLENEGHKVHYPPRDTNQDDPVGLDICTENRAAINEADEIHIYWNPTSQGSLFDFGMLFMAEKPLKLINRDDVERTPHKSFQNVLLELDAKYR